MSFDISLNIDQEQYLEMKQKWEVLELTVTKLSKRIQTLEESVSKKFSKTSEEFKKFDSKVTKLDQKLLKKVITKVNEKLELFANNDDKIKQIDLKMVDICETMEGMVQIIKDNGAQVRAQLEQRIESVTQDIEIFETQINRSNSEMTTQIQNLQTHNQRIVDALKNFHAQQIHKFNTLSECEEEDETEENDESEAEQDQENMVPNKDSSNQFQSKTLVDLLKSQGVKLQLSKDKKPNPSKQKNTNKT